jgi:DNA polymerase-3 subunit gamma/tau
MAKKAAPPDTSGVEDHAPQSDGKYTVVARRYRPKTFSELVGQSTVAQALVSAIQSNRVGHAYLFTGARGVGKTSTARIFAKALNASAGLDGGFDPNSEIALAIDSGEDMDVLEIDGASNRGIDEIRQLRANAAVRPSRSRYKIYIIDEVHMLTTQAFNALLKTLEEPPAHVKFVFCTTDPEKIPITVLSRCQRFDFPPVHSDEIYERLKFICKNEGTQADEAALRLIARRAAGSMRDSQSLLEQLLSFGGDRITVESVHAMLGTADETRLASFAGRLIQRDAAGALRDLDRAASEGVDVGQLAEQLLGYLRDMMTVTVGGDSDLMRTANSNSADQLREWGKTWGTMTLLAALQLLDETIVKMRYSVQARVLLEVALVQICNLQDLQALSDLVKAFALGQSAPVPKPALSPSAAPTASTDAKKKVDLVAPFEIRSHGPDGNMPSAPVTDPALTEPAVVGSVHVPSTDAQPTAVTPVVPGATVATHSLTDEVNASSRVTIDTFEVDTPEPGPAPSLTDASPASSSSESEPANIESTIPMADSDLLAIFRETAEQLGGFAKECAELAVHAESVNDSQLKIGLSREGQIIQDYFQTGTNSKRLTLAIQQRLQRTVTLVFELTNAATPAKQSSNAIQPPTPEPPAYSPTERSVPQAQLIRAAMNDPLVKRFMEVFDGQIVRVDPPKSAVASPHLQVAESISP